MDETPHRSLEMLHARSWEMELLLSGFVLVLLLPLPTYVEEKGLFLVFSFSFLAIFLILAFFIALFAFVGITITLQQAVALFSRRPLAGSKPGYTANGNRYYGRCAHRLVARRS